MPPGDVVESLLSTASEHAGAFPSGMTGLMEHKLVDWCATAKVLVNDAVHVFLGDVVVPGPVRLHAHYRAALASGEAAHPAALDAQFTRSEPGSLELVSQVVKQRL